MKLQLLNDYVDVISGQPFKPEFFNADGRGLPLIRVRDVNTGFAGIYYSGEYRPTALISDGDLLVSMDGDFKCIEWRGGTAVLNQRVCKIVPKDDLDINYLLCFLPAALDAIHRKTTYTTVKHLSVKKIRAIKIPLPTSKSTQTHIATLLRHCEQLIRWREESISLLEDYVRSVFLEMFGDPVSMSKRDLPLLEGHIKYITSGSRGWATYYTDDTTAAKFLRIQNVGDGQLKLNDLAYVNAPESAEAKRTKVAEGDLLISITADLGRTAVIPKNYGEAYINQHLALVRLKNDIDPIYLAYYFAMPFGRKQLQRKNKSNVKSGLNFTDIKTTPVYVPSPTKQKLFVSIIEEVEKTKRDLYQSLTHFRNLYASYSQRAFRGELDPDRLAQFASAVSATHSATLKSKSTGKTEYAVDSESVQKTVLPAAASNSIQTNKPSSIQADWRKMLNEYPIESEYMKTVAKSLGFPLGIAYEDFRERLFQRLEDKDQVIDQFFSPPALRIKTAEE